MSQTTPEDLTQFNLRDVLARIDRQQAETRKFVAEHDRLTIEREKLAAERDKLTAEREKLLAEADKFRRGYGLAPWIVVGGPAGGVLTAGVVLLRILGALP